MGVVRLSRHIRPLCVDQNLLSVGPGSLPERSHMFSVRTLKYWIILLCPWPRTPLGLALLYLLLLFTLGVVAF